MCGRPWHGGYPHRGVLELRCPPSSEPSRSRPCTRQSTPLVLPETTDGSLADLPGRLAGADPGRVTFSVRSGGGWTDVTAATFAADVAALAKGFIAAGIGVGDAVGIMSRTRYEWTVADFALWSAGAVPVPIYETSSPDQVEWILADSGAVGVLVESDAHLAAGRARPRAPVGPAPRVGHRLR